MICADFSFYREAYKGNAIPEAEFERLALRAGGRVDRMTRFRGEAYAAAHPEDTRLKNAVCAVAEALYRAERAGEGATLEGGQAVVSEANDGYAVTYKPPRDGFSREAQAELDMACREAAAGDLLPTGLLYAGVRGG